MNLLLFSLTYSDFSFLYHCTVKRAYQKSLNLSIPFCRSYLNRFKLMQTSAFPKIFFNKIGRKSIPNIRYNVENMTKKKKRNEEK